MTEADPPVPGHHREAAAEATRPAPVVRSFGLTDRGRVRTNNEDQFLIAELARTLWVRQTSLPQEPTQYGRNRAYILLVADGIGGSKAGEVASALTMVTVEEFVLHVLHRFSNLQVQDERGVVRDLKEALREANARIFQQTAHHPELSGMGTTLTMALVSGWRLFAIHAGDSRCYLYRKAQLTQLTLDHTLVGELARRGGLPPEALRHSPFRHVVTNAVGGSQESVRVDVSKAHLEPDDVVLLCSDGLTEALDDAAIAAILAAEGEPQAACESLVAAANARGGPDNITAVIARFEAP